MMNSRTFLLAIGALFAIAGCDKKGDNAPASASSPVAATPSTPPTGCSPQHTSVADGGFCVKVPTTWTLKPPFKNGAITQFIWGTGGPNFAISLVAGTALPPDAKAFIPPATAGKGTVTEGDFAAGKGKWILSSVAGGGALDSTYRVWLVSPKGLLDCGGSGDPEGAKKGLEMCQTIAPLGT